MPDKIKVSGTIASQVTDLLREDIIQKRIEVGSRITIKEISERYGTSPMPVREAFRTLEGEKLLEINAYKGATVLCIDEDFIRDIYGLLRALEGLMFETVMPELTEKDLSQLKDINDQIKSAADNEIGKRLYIDLNTQFHSFITSRCRNTKARELFLYHHGLIRTMRKSYLPKIERIQDAVAEHEALIEALASRDAIALKNAVDTHVNHAMENFLRIYIGNSK